MRKVLFILCSLLLSALLFACGTVSDAPAEIPAVSEIQIEEETAPRIIPETEAVPAETETLYTTLDTALGSVTVPCGNLDESAALLSNLLSDADYSIVLPGDEKVTVKLSQIADIGPVSVTSDDILAGSIDLKPFYTFSEEKLQLLTDTLFSGPREGSEDASIALNREELQYVIVPETYGTEPADDAVHQLYEAMEASDGDTLNTEELPLYKTPEVRSTDYQLKSVKDKMNRYLYASVTFEYNQHRFTFDKNNLWDYVTVVPSEENPSEVEVTVSRERLYRFVRNTFSKYATAEGTLFTTSTTEKIDMGYGVFTATPDYNAITDKIIEVVQQGKKIRTTLPISQYVALAPGKPMTNSYVEVSLAEQKVWLHIDGKTVLESDVVTGLPGGGRQTRTGVFSIRYKSTNTTLIGANYACFVNYWMPFDHGIGLHDADGWRNKYGGNLYKSEGTHGCVNMPGVSAKTIYENVTPGTIVIVWDRAEG